MALNLPKYPQSKPRSETCSISSDQRITCGSLNLSVTVFGGASDVASPWSLALVDCRKYSPLLPIC